MHHSPSSFYLFMFMIHYAFVIFIYVHWYLHHGRIQGDSAPGVRGAGGIAAPSGGEPRRSHRRRRGSWGVAWVSGVLPHHLHQRQAPEHFHSLLYFKRTNILSIVLCSCIKYRSWMLPLMHLYSLSTKIPCPI